MYLSVRLALHATRKVLGKASVCDIQATMQQVHGNACRKETSLAEMSHKAGSGKTTSSCKLHADVLPAGKHCVRWSAGMGRQGDLGVEGDPSQPVSVALPTHDEVSPGQVPHLPGLVVTACHLHGLCNAPGLDAYLRHYAVAGKTKVYYKPVGCMPWLYLSIPCALLRQHGLKGLHHVGLCSKSPLSICNCTKMGSEVAMVGMQGAYHNGLGWVHGQATDRHEVPLECLGQVKRFDIHRREGEAGNWVASGASLNITSQATDMHLLCAKHISQ